MASNWLLSCRLFKTSIFSTMGFSWTFPNGKCRGGLRFAVGFNLCLFTRLIVIFFFVAFSQSYLIKSDPYMADKLSNAAMKATRIRAKVKVAELRVTKVKGQLAEAEKLVKSKEQWFHDWQQSEACGVFVNKVGSKA